MLDGIFEFGEQQRIDGHEVPKEHRIGRGANGQQHGVEVNLASALCCLGYILLVSVGSVNTVLHRCVVAVCCSVVHGDVHGGSMEVIVRLTYWLGLSVSLNPWYLRVVVEQPLV